MPPRFDFHADLECRICGKGSKRSGLDRHLWCQACRSEIDQRARRWRHAIAAAITVPFAIWIVLEGTNGTLPPYAWLLPLAAAYYLGMRIGREVVKGVLRARREKLERTTLTQANDTSPSPLTDT